MHVAWWTQHLWIIVIVCLMTLHDCCVFPAKSVIFFCMMIRTYFVGMSYSFAWWNINSPWMRAYTLCVGTHLISTVGIVMNIYINQLFNMHDPFCMTQTIKCINFLSFFIMSKYRQLTQVIFSHSQNFILSVFWHHENTLSAPNWQ